MSDPRRCRTDTKVLCVRGRPCHTWGVNVTYPGGRALQRAALRVTLAVALTTPMTAAAVSTTEDATADAVLNIRVTNVRSESGHVLLLVFNDASGFPNVSGKAVHRVRIRAQKGRVSHSVPGLPPGRYAITVVHDENDNKKLDKNLFGIPKEGWGTSRNPRPRTRAPRWSESSFALEASANKAVAISLLYP